jgi:hypothetical protein
MKSGSRRDLKLAGGGKNDHDRLCSGGNKEDCLHGIGRENNGGDGDEGVQVLKERDLR